MLRRPVWLLGLLGRWYLPFLLEMFLDPPFEPRLVLLSLATGFAPFRGWSLLGAVLVEPPFLERLRGALGQDVFTKWLLWLTNGQSGPGVGTRETDVPEPNRTRTYAEIVMSNREQGDPTSSLVGSN